MDRRAGTLDGDNRSRRLEHSVIGPRCRQSKRYTLIFFANGLASMMKRASLNKENDEKSGDESPFDLLTIAPSFCISVSNRDRCAGSLRAAVLPATLT